MASGSAPTVDAWWVELDLPADRRDAVATVLSERERARAARFRRERDAHRWSVARGALRHILGEALGVASAGLEFDEGEHGKPSVRGAGARGLAFNLSHSGGMALVAVTDGHEIGADVEEIVAMDDMSLVAERHFAPEERAALFALPEPERLDAFFRIWTRKEAYIKAIGHGLSHPLDRFAVSIARGEARLVHLDGDATAAAAWTLVHLEAPRPGYVGALAMPFVPAGVRVRSWTLAS